MKVLLVEDNPGDALLVRTTFARMPEPRPSVVHAPTLADARRALSGGDFDLVLTDLNLPDSDGLDTCRALCDGGSVPVVVLTSGEQTELEVQVLDLGAQDYLVKGQWRESDLARVLHHARLRHGHQQELRAAVDAAVAANQAKNAFLSSMSHELRTPLNAIIGFGELLRDLSAGDLAPKQERYVENILASARHLLGLIGDVLDLAKIEAGKMALEQTVFDAAAQVAGVIDLVRPLAVKKDLTLETALPPALPPLRADEQKFKQVLYNLLSNAIKFTPVGGRVTARLERATVEQLGDALRLRVEDTGAGLSPDELELVFEDFVQVGAHDAPKQTGTGLGLALTRRIVELHGGRIRAESPGRGRGSTFVVELPLRAGAASSPLSADPRRRSRVLVVEDNELDRELLIDLLERSGHEVGAVGDGETALEMACAAPPDAVIMDIVLPGIDGLETTRRLKRDPRTAHAPVIAVSARASRVDSAAALAAGCAIHIAKPFDTRTLGTVVGEILRSSRRGRAR